MTKWFSIQNRVGTGAISIFDEIGAGGITAKDFQDELKALGDVAHITLSINSPGGNVFDGLAIYNMLRRHKARVTVTIDGIAASIASVIAMAGDAILMPENAMMMIHDPRGLVVGNSRDMRDLAAALDKIKQGLVSAYAGKTGEDREYIAELMEAETWTTAQEAVEMGFADAVEEPVRIAAHFDLERLYGKAPERKPPLPALDPVAIYARYNRGGSIAGKPVRGMATTGPPSAPTSLLGAAATQRIYDKFNGIS